MRPTWAVTLVAACGLCLALAAGAREPRAADAKPVSDEQFVMMASAADLAEISLGRLAAQRAASDEVKKYGQRMVDDHGKSSKELIALADKKGIPVAKEMDKKHRQLLTKLAGKAGAEFDQAYMKHMVMDHKEALALYQGQAKGGKDEDLKAFAAKTVPVVRDHLKSAQALAGRLQGGNGGEGKGEGKERPPER
jgi:putative membrane protein